MVAESMGIRRVKEFKNEEEKIGLYPHPRGGNKK
jgi:hypothetical protein